MDDLIQWKMEITDLGTPLVNKKTIGGKNARTDFLLKAHAEREVASLTGNSKSELALITDALNERLLRILNRNLP